jgi:hypothetical protein
MERPLGISVLRIVAVAWCVVVAGYIAWGWYGYAGLYRAVAEWQVVVFGSYRVFLTALLPGIALALPGIAVAAMLQRASRRLQTAPVDPRRGLWAITVVGLMGLAIAAIAGSLGWQKASRLLEVAELDVGQSGSLPHADRFVVSGMARTDLMLAVDTDSRGARRNYAYVPITPPDWRPGQPLTYFLKTEQNAFLPTDDGRAVRLSAGDAPFAVTTGPAAVEAQKLPGQLREAYRTQNVPVARQAFIFTQGAPAMLEHYWIAAAIGALIAIACLLAASVTAARLRYKVS